MHVTPFRFTGSDIDDGTVRVKHMSILDYAQVCGAYYVGCPNFTHGFNPPHSACTQGKLLLNQASLDAQSEPAAAAAAASTPVSGSGSEAALRLRLLAVRNFDSALRSDTLSLHASKEKVSVVFHAWLTGAIFSG